MKTTTTFYQFHQHTLHNFGSVDDPKAIKYMALKTKIKRICILNKNIKYIIYAYHFWF